MTAAETDLSAQVEQAVRDLMPGLRQLARQGLIWILLTLVATAAGTILALQINSSDPDVWKFALLVLIVGGALVGFLYRRMHRGQEMLVMPVLSGAVGLSYAKDAKPFLNALPPRLLPKGVRSAEDHISGQLGAHAVQLAEVRVITGGKNSRTLFEGLVAQFPNRTAMPAFFLAAADKTRPGVFFGGDLGTEGLQHLRDVTGPSGKTYGIWTSAEGASGHPALDGVASILTGIETLVGEGATLYSATSNGVEMHLALTFKRNLFHVGGLFPDEGAIFEDVRRALQDLTVPLTLARALIEAETKAARLP